MTRTRTRLAVLAAAATALVPLAGGTASAAPTPDRPGAVRGGDTRLLRAALSGGAPTTRFAYGRPTDHVHVTGDWDGNGFTDLGGWRPGTATFLGRQAPSLTADARTVTAVRFGRPRP